MFIWVFEKSLHLSSSSRVHFEQWLCSWPNWTRNQFLWVQILGLMARSPAISLIWYTLPSGDEIPIISRAPFRRWRRQSQQGCTVLPPSPFSNHAACRYGPTSCVLTEGGLSSKILIKTAWFFPMGHSCWISIRIHFDFWSVCIQFVFPLHLELKGRFDCI